MGRAGKVRCDGAFGEPTTLGIQSTEG